MDWTSAQGFIETFGFPMGAALLFVIAVVSRRKDKSSFLVPGWIHDNVIEELETIRSYYQARELELRIECDRHIAEYRELYEGERGLRVELDKRFKEVNDRRARDHAENQKMIREIRIEIEESRKRNGGT